MPGDYRRSDGDSSGTDAAGNRDHGVSTSGGAGINSRDSQCSDILLGPPASSGSSVLGSRPINGDALENAANVNTPRWIAHNEDARTLNFGLMYLLDGQVPLTTSASSSVPARSSMQAPADDESFASAPSAAAGTVSFTAYMYAGVLPTGALAYVRSSSTSYASPASDAAIQPPSVPADAGNPGAGLYFTLNGIFPLAINTTAPSIPRAFLHRYVLESSGLDDAIDRLSSTQVACGFSINIGQVRPAYAPYISLYRRTFIFILSFHIVICPSSACFCNLLSSSSTPCGPHPCPSVHVLVCT